MSLTAGALSQVSVGATTASLSSAVATMGTAPYTYQWYRSTTTGFSPGGGNIITGATSLTLNDSGLVPNTIYFYKVVATDSASPAATSTSSQLAVTTTATTLSQNVFAQSPVVGMLDMNFNYDTISCQIDSSVNATLLYQGQAVKIVANTKGGVPRVAPCTGISDNVLGFINFDIKSVSFAANAMVEVSSAGNVMFLYATGAITQGAQVCLDYLSTGGVQATGNSATVVGFALDGASAAGQLIRVRLTTPSFATA
jgi:hypothetical protein